MLGAGPRAQKGDDVMGQQCHHTKRIILQKYFIAAASPVSGLYQQMHFCFASSEFNTLFH